jgi:hypothetical protein
MRETTSAGKGQKIITESGPKRGENVPNKNTVMPSGFAGGPRDLSRTLGSGSTPRNDNKG